MQTLTHIAANTWAMAVAAAPWLFVGFVAAGLIKAFAPTRWVARALGGKGPAAVLRASVVGIPLPLCSCGVLPTAIGLRRQGAGRPATVSFLVSTPEIGVDSFLLSYALLGPVMAITRPIAAFGSAVVAGFAALAVDRAEPDAPTGEPAAADGCCAKKTDCCAGDGDERRAGFWRRLFDGQRYVFTQLLDDISKWLVVAIVVAGLVTAVFDESQLAGLGSGPLAMVVMLLVGIPLYLCATASTPLAAGLLAVGVSPGTVLVLLLAGPATNIGSIGVLRRELGGRVVIAYLAAIAVCSLGAGLALDAVVAAAGFDVMAQATHGHEHDVFPEWFAYAAVGLLLLVGVRPLRRLLARPFVGGGAEAAPSCCGGKGSGAEQPPADAPRSCCAATANAADTDSAADRAAAFRV